MDTSEVKTRRRYSDAFRRQVVAETWQRGTSVSQVARRHDLNANMVFNWRRRYRHVIADDTPALIPVHLASPALPETAAPVPDASTADGYIRLVLASGHELTVTGTIAPKLVRTVLEALR